jgi:hypothetical protein
MSRFVVYHVYDTASVIAPSLLFSQRVRKVLNKNSFLAGERRDKDKHGITT